ncbi:MAG: hypothetical protein AAF721_04360 [Myxococcota bacterium]
MARRTTGIDAIVVWCAVAAAGGCVVEEGAADFREDPLAEDPDYDGWQADDEQGDDEPGDPVDGPPPGCCETFDCGDSASRPDAGVCGGDFSVCQALEDCCDHEIKGCFKPEDPAGCAFYDDLKPDGYEWWEAYFQETVDLAPIKFPYNAEAWPISTAVAAVAGVAFKRLAAPVTVLSIGFDVIEASQNSINAFDDGECQCLWGREVRGYPLSTQDSPREELLCWQYAEHPEYPGHRTCQVEEVYTDCAYRDAATGTSVKAVLQDKDYKCECSPGSIKSIYDEHKGGISQLECPSDLHVCVCIPKGSQIPAYVSCDYAPKTTCTRTCAPGALDCRSPDALVPCTEIDFDPID